MPQYFCHECALRESRINPLYNEDDIFSTATPSLSGTTYQLDKFIKHTIPSSHPGKVSIFTDPSYSSYENYTISTSLSGGMELDDYGRTNLVWYAGQNTGFTLYNGVIQYPTDGVKVVLHDDDQLIHAYAG